MALFTPEERDAAAERLLQLLREDERVERAELAGSGVSGYADRAQYYIGLLRWRTLTLATDRLGLEFSEYKDVDDLPDDVLAPLADSLPRSLEAGELARAAEAATQAFLAELRRIRPELADRLEPRLLGRGPVGASLKAGRSAMLRATPALGD